MVQRYCTNCGAELRDDDSFCGKCGRQTHQTAAVATPEADVSVPTLSQEESSGQIARPARMAGKVSEAESKRNAFIALAVVIALIVLIIAEVAGYGGSAIVLLAIAGLVAFALYNRQGEQVEREGGGRLVLRPGFNEPVSEAERNREFEEEIAQYLHEGFFVRQRTATTAQLVRPKKFSFIWALLWFLLFGIGIVVYLIYYAAKQDEGRYLEVDEYGAVKATRQVRHVL
jgi:hypothetical protein